MLPAVREQTSLQAFASQFAGGDRELTDLRRQRDEALAAGNGALVAELSVRIVDRVEKAGQVLAADVKLQTNEQVKYSGTFVNGMATAIFSAGVATPVLGVFIPGSIYATNLLLLGEVSGGCFLTAIVLHLIVRQMLRRLRA